MPDFTHLHCHTHYSLLDGASNIQLLLKKAADSGMTALAITDHGNMYGVMEFVREAEKAGIKPIIGCEIYVAEGSRFNKQGKQDRSGYHLILLAKNLEGYRNLCTLTSLGFLEGFYYTPRIDKELLRKYHNGLIASTACLGGELPDTILNKAPGKAEELLEDFIDIFGDDFYLELQRHGHPEQATVNAKMLELAAKYNRKVIATNDCHFINASDFPAHQILICLNTGKDLQDEKGMMYTGQEFLKTPDEMAELFKDIPEAIGNTQLLLETIEKFSIIAEKVILPEFPLPEGFDDADEYLRHLTYLGAGKYYPDMTPETRDRLEYELNTIHIAGFAGYFLIVQDFIAYAREHDVLVGPGRGSAAGSAVAYCTGITSIDPIQYNLLFERFLNPERVNMPDIDIDFDDEGRDRVIQYVVNKYGDKRVAQIVTFGTMAARSSIRDVARVLKLPLPEADRLAKLIPLVPGMDLKKAYADVKEFADVFKGTDELAKKTLEFARVLEGSARHTGTHACGVIIGKDDLIQHIPLGTAKDAQLMVTQYEGKYVEDAGMLKMDFLGLKTLSIIKDAVINIHQRNGVKVDINNIPLEDEKTFELFQNADTIGIFQFESDGMRQYLRRLKPTHIEDLIAMNALFRPGPMDFIPTYINRKHGKEAVEYPHKMLEEILKPTFGIMVYQEQIMQTARIMGGFTLGKADLLRRAMGKKQMDVMEKAKSEFVEGACNKGVEPEKAAKVFATMQEFAKYGFNRSHSAAYSILAYRTAWLKAHYPAEFMAAILTHNLNEIKKITFYIDECKKLGIHVLGPDVNESDLKFSVNAKGDIHFGLAAIKGIGEAAVGAIIVERSSQGTFDTFFDFMKRINLRTVNKKSVEALAMAGAFDNLPGLHRAMFFHKDNQDDLTFLEKVIRHTTDQAGRGMASQQDLFGAGNGEHQVRIEMPQCTPWTKLEQLKFEKEVTGFYMSGHPLDDFRVEIDHFCNVKLDEIGSEGLHNFRSREVTFAGMVTGVTNKTSRTGNAFGTMTLEDYYDSVSLTLFSEDYLRNKHFMEEGNFLLVRAKVESRYNNPDALELKVISINLLADTLEKFVHDLTLVCNLQDLDDEIVKDMKKVITPLHGKCRLKFQVRDTTGNISVELSAKKVRVNCLDVLKKIRDFPRIHYRLN